MSEISAITAPMRALGIFLVLSFIFAIGGLMMFMNGKVEVEPTRILNPTNFTEPEQVGAIVFRRFWQEIRDNKLVIVGSSPFVRDYDRVWRGFFSVAEQQGIKFKKVFIQNGLRAISTTSEPLDWEKVQLSLIGDEPVFVHLVSTDEMLAQARERTRTGLIIFQELLPVTESQKAQLRQRCPEPQQKPVTIACLGAQALSHGKRKRFDDKKITAVIERQGEREHILFIHEP